MKRSLRLVLPALVSASCSFADSRFIMVTDRFGGRVMLFSAADGALVNPEFIDLNALGGPWAYPVEPIQVGNEIWISDIQAGLQRYSADGASYLGPIGSGLVNYTLGFEVVDGIAYVPIGLGPMSGTVVMLDRFSHLEGSFFVGGSNTDILRRNDELLIHHNDAGGSVILRYSFAGTPLGSFTCSGCASPAFGRQLALHPDGGVLAADSAGSGGLFRYSPAGQLVSVYQPFWELWGIHMLDNGRAMFATRKGSGTAGVFDLVTGGAAVVASALDAFGTGLLVLPAPCYPNCDSSTATPLLNANDFQCFLNRFAAADSYANCDGSTTPPVLNANDFQCFLNAYAAGCS